MPDSLPTQDQQLAIGVTRLREHMLNHAELIFRRMLEATPDHPQARRYLGVTLCKLGRRDEALPLLQAPDAAADLEAALHGGPFSTDQAEHPFKVIDYPYRASVRYGSGRPPHAGLADLIGAGTARFRDLLDALSEIAADFDDIPLGGSYETATPFWLNAWFPPLDGMVLTQMLRAYDPARFVEIGSGTSTKFARRAVARYGLRTRLTSIDPEPRSEVDALCDEVIRRPLEACGTELFEALEPGDILFLDSSHRAFQGSDVTVFFLDILPRLKPGVIVQIHDVYLPDDYISGHVGRLWNEQYLLATALLFGRGAIEILFPCWYVHQHGDLSAHARDRLAQGPRAGLNLYGASFWFRTT